MKNSLLAALLALAFGAALLGYQRDEPRRQALTECTTNIEREDPDYLNEVVVISVQNLFFRRDPFAPHTWDEARFHAIYKERCVKRKLALK